MYAGFVKPVLDRLVAAVALLLLSPVIITIATGVAVFLGRPVFFRQLRPGLRGRPFAIFKFRTMTDQRDGDGRLLPDGVRLTRLGKLLRATSLDELPALLNVLRGEMSLVGPRPLLMQYLARYSPEQARRHDVRPGITGLAQVNGRNSLSWDDKFVLDVWYVDHMSLVLDLRILALTVWRTLLRQGITQPGYDTASEFRGSANIGPHSS